MPAGFPARSGESIDSAQSERRKPVLRRALGGEVAAADDNTPVLDLALLARGLLSSDQGIAIEVAEQGDIDPFLDSEDDEALYGNKDAANSFYARAILGCIEVAPVLMKVTLSPSLAFSWTLAFSLSLFSLSSRDLFLRPAAHYY